MRFTPLDEQHPLERTRGDTDTVTLKMRRCGCCSSPMWREPHENMPELCDDCDDRLMADRVRLILEGRRMPRSDSG